VESVGDERPQIGPEPARSAAVLAALLGLAWAIAALGGNQSLAGVAVYTLTATVMGGLFGLQVAQYYRDATWRIGRYFWGFGLYALIPAVLVVVCVEAL
jgi:hypothetical protein